MSKNIKTTQLFLLDNYEIFHDHVTVSWDPKAFSHTHYDFCLDIATNKDRTKVKVAPTDGHETELQKCTFGFGCNDANGTWDGQR